MSTFDYMNSEYYKAKKEEARKSDINKRIKKTMANNRLYLVDTTDKEYLCIAKLFGIEWEVINIDLYKKFIEGRLYLSHLIVISEDDKDKGYYQEYIINGSNFNTENIFKTENDTKKSIMVEQTDVKLTYRSKLTDNSKGNKFINIPDDVADLLHKVDGTMQGIVENLYPDQDFIIEISIKSI